MIKESHHYFCGHSLSVTTSVILVCLKAQHCERKHTRAHAHRCALWAFKSNYVYIFLHTLSTFSVNYHSVWLSDCSCNWWSSNSGSGIDYQYCSNCHLFLYMRLRKPLLFKSLTEYILNVIRNMSYYNTARFSSLLYGWASFSHIPSLDGRRGSRAKYSFNKKL